MTAYEKLEIHNNPMFDEHLKNIDSVNAELFEKALEFFKVAENEIYSVM